jgi:hypothetical protein
VTTFLSVSSALLMGLVLVVCPWTSLWDTNYLLQLHPLLRDLMLNPYLRGAVSGLGLVNLMLAVLEVHAHLRRTTGPLSS